MSHDQFEIPRRELLTLGSACALTAGLTGSRSAAAAVDCWLGRDHRSLSLAYWPESERLPGFDGLSELTEVLSAEDEEDLPRPTFGQLVAADQLTAGDSSFARTGVRLRIHGLYGKAPAALEALPSLAVDLHFRPFHDTVVHAWRFESGDQPCPCPPTALAVPVTEAEGLNLSFTLGDGADMAPATRFSLGREGGSAKLRRGVYLARWRGAGGASLPSWRYRSLASLPEDADDDKGKLQIALARPDLAIDHAYLVMSFDHAA